LEDRASLAFWRWVSAQSDGSASALARISTAELVQATDAELNAIAQSGRRKMFLDCAVGAVSTVSIERQADQQLAHVDLRWSVKSYLAPLGADGQPPKLDAKAREAVITTPQRSVFTFARSIGAKTNTNNGMATTRCPSCSAPEPLSGELRCSFCGTPFNDGAKEWALSAVRTWEQFQAVARTTPRPSVGNGATAVVDRDERERLLYMMIAIAQADGQIDAKEKALIKMCAERWGVPWMKVELVLTIDASAMFDKLLLAKATPAAEQFLQQLVEIAQVDGRIDRRERKMLEAAATRLGLTERLRGMIQ
jgi:tellurite resistance protein